ncbi:MAG TPA: TIR domain-containing protein [Thermoanaerobaculia bacterium]
MNLFGPDIFISYSRVDGAGYAERLAYELSLRDITCFVDQWGSPPGAELPPMLLLKLIRSRMFVLIVTDGATKSESVAKEIRTFLPLERTIVPIVVGDVWDRAPWRDKLEGLARTAESPESLDAGAPTPAVVNRVSGAAAFTRRNQIVRRIFGLLGAAMFVAAAATGYYTWKSRREQSERLRVVHAQEMASASASQLADDPQTALLLAIEAVKTAPEIDRLERTLRSAIAESRVRAEFSFPGEREARARFSPDGRLIAVSTASHARLLDWASGRVTLDIPITSARTQFSANTRYLLISNDRRFDLVDVRAQKVVMSHESILTPVISDDGHYVAFAVYSHAGDEVEIIDVEKRSIIRSFVASESGPVEMAFVPRSTELAVWDNHSGIRFWSVGDEKRRSPFKPVDPGSFYMGPISAGGRVVIFSIFAGHDSALWDMSTSKPIARLPAQSSDLIRFSPDGSWLMAYGEDVTTVRIWRADTGEAGAPLIGHSDRVTDIAFDPHTSRVATSSADGTTRVWTKDGQLEMILWRHVGGTTSVDFDPSGERLLTGGDDGVVRICDVNTGIHPVRTWQGSNESDYGLESHVRFDRTGSRVLFGGGSNGVTGWNLATGVAATTRIDGYMSGAFSEDGRFVVLGTDSVWAVDGRKLLFRFPGEAIAFSQDGRQLLVRLMDGVKVLDVPTGRAVATIPVQPWEEVGWAPAVRRIAIISREGPYRVLDYSARLLFGTRAYPSDSRIWLSPNGRMLVVPQAEKKLILIDLQRRTRTTLDRPDDYLRDVHFSHRGDVFMTMEAQGSAALWRTADGNLIAELRGHTKAVTDAAFSADDEFVVTFGSDPEARVWDTRTGSLVHVFESDGGALRDAAFSPNGHYVATASADNIIQVFVCDACRTGPALLRLAKQRALRDLTRGERITFAVDAR